MIGYVKCFEDNKKMFFRVIDNKLLNKYTQKQKKSFKFIEYKV